MSLLYSTTSLILGGMLLGLGGLVVYVLLKARQGVDDMKTEVEYLRPPAEIITPDLGPCVAVAWDPETQTSGHMTVRDANGKLRTIPGVHNHELRAVDIKQAIFGPGRPQYEYIPSNVAKERAMRYNQSINMLSEITTNKQEKEEAQRKEMVAKSNVDMELKKSVERMKELNRQLPQFGGVKK